MRACPSPNARRPNLLTIYEERMVFEQRMMINLFALFTFVPVASPLCHLALEKLEEPANRPASRPPKPRNPDNTQGRRTLWRQSGGKKQKETNEDPVVARWPRAEQKEMKENNTERILWVNFEPNHEVTISDHPVSQ